MDFATTKLGVFVGAALLVFAAIAGCGTSLDRNPLAGQSESVRNASSPDRVVAADAAPTPSAQDVLRIDTADYYSFKEGIASEIKLAARVLTPIDGHEAINGQDYELTIDNLGEFPGASFNKDTEVFSWAPPREFVADSATRNAHLQLTLTTRKEPVLSLHRAVGIFVTRTEVDPEVVKVDDLKSTPVREGDVRTFKVTVYDPDSINADNKRPRLLIVSNTSSSAGATKNGVHLVSLAPSKPTEPNPIQDPADKTKWVFTMNLDLKDREVTKGAETLNFALIAISRFGRSSAPFNVEALVWTNISEPEVSWGAEPIDVVAGAQNVISFSVFDPGRKGRVSAEIANCEKLPGRATCRCSRRETEASQICTIEWQVARDAPLGFMKIEGKTFNQSLIPTDSKSVEKPFSGEVRILPNSHEPPPPQPSPSLPPTPTPTAEVTAGPTVTPVSPPPTGSLVSPPQMNH